MLFVAPSSGKIKMLDASSKWGPESIYCIIFAEILFGDFATNFVWRLCTNFVWLCRAKADLIRSVSLNIICAKFGEDWKKNCGF